MAKAAIVQDRIARFKLKFLPAAERSVSWSSQIDSGAGVSVESPVTKVTGAPISNAVRCSTQHTLGHIGCAVCETSRTLAMRSLLDPALSFQDAAVEWLSFHSQNISPRSADDYQQYIAVLLTFGIGTILLREIHIGHFREFQAWRKTNPKRGAGNPRINQELNCLSQILQAAGLWKDIKPFYKPLPLPKWKPPRVMSPEKEEEVLRIAASNKNWEVAHCALVIADNTGIGPGELRGILVEHLHLGRGVVDVAAGEKGGKTEFRTAPMALNKTARAAFGVLLARYFEVLGRQNIEYDDKHYLVPRRLKRGTYDPTRPASPSFIRSALREIRVLAGLPKLRYYDFRHQLITSMLEIPDISIETVQAVARHRIGTRTIEHYSAIRMEKKQQAVNLLETIRERGTQKAFAARAGKNF